MLSWVLIIQLERETDSGEVRTFTFRLKAPFGRFHLYNTDAIALENKAPFQGMDSSTCLTLSMGSAICLCYSSLPNELASLATGGISHDNRGALHELSTWVYRGSWVGSLIFPGFYTSNERLLTISDPACLQLAWICRCELPSQQ